MRIMSLDVGSVTIGVAVSDLFGWTAQGLETIRHTTREADFKRLRELTDQYKVEEFVIGLPLNMDGTKGIRWKGQRPSQKNFPKPSRIFPTTSGTKGLPP